MHPSVSSKTPRTAVLSALMLVALPTAALSQGSATYEVRFQATWIQANQPGAFPFGAHFSPLIGAVHGPGFSLSQPGGMASPGIESMAETGGSFVAQGEVNAAIQAGTAAKVINGPAVALSPGSVLTTLEVTDGFPLVSLTTMVAPSPDWFLGVHDVPLLQGGNWVDNLVVPLFAYDAGTDSGPDFNSADSDTNPAQPIAQILGSPFGALPPLGTFTFTRKHSSLVYGSDVNPAGSIALVTGKPVLGTSIVVRLADPTGQFPTQANTMLGLALAPAAGGLVPTYGLAGNDAPGEALLGAPFAVLGGPVYFGAPVELTLQVPNLPALVGLSVYAQGAFFEPTTGQAGLTRGLALQFGN